jgi:hypothetical protein
MRVRPLIVCLAFPGRHHVVREDEDGEAAGVAIAGMSASHRR